MLAIMPTTRGVVKPDHHVHQRKGGSARPIPLLIKILTVESANSSQAKVPALTRARQLPKSKYKYISFAKRKPMQAALGRHIVLSIRYHQTPSRTRQFGYTYTGNTHNAITTDPKPQKRTNHEYPSPRTNATQTRFTNRDIS